MRYQMPDLKYYCEVVAAIPGLAVMFEDARQDAMTADKQPEKTGEASGGDKRYTENPDRERM